MSQCYMNEMSERFIYLEKIELFSLKYKCLKVTFLFFLSTLDEVDFPALLDQETKFLLIIILDSISPGELGTVRLNGWSF